MLDWDLTDIPLQEFTLQRSSRRSPPFYVTSLKLIVTLKPRLLKLKLFWKDRTLSSKDIDVHMNSDSWPPLRKVPRSHFDINPDMRGTIRSSEFSGLGEDSAGPQAHHYYDHYPVLGGIHISVFWQSFSTVNLAFPGVLKWFRRVLIKGAKGVTGPDPLAA